MVYQEIDINIFYTGGPPQWVYITQGDTTLGGFKFNIIYNNDYWEIPAGTVFYFSGTRPDGHGFSYPCTWSGHTVECAVEQSMSDYPGEISCVLAAYDSSNGVVGSGRVIAYAEQHPLDRVRLNENDFRSINTAIDAAKKVLEHDIVYGYENGTESFYIRRR